VPPAPRRFRKRTSGRYDEIRVDLRGVVDAREDGPGVVCLAVPGEPLADDGTKPGLHRAIAGCPAEPYEHPDCWRQRFSCETPTLARLRGDGGMSFHQIPTARMPMWRSGHPSVAGEPVGNFLAGTYDLRATGFVARAIYVGGEIQAGFGNGPPRNG